MKLSIVRAGDSGGENKQTFDGDGVIRVGRNADNDCVFDDPNARTVSGFHAEIHLSGRTVVIMDNNSTNGLLVNGQWAERANLSPGDTVELGKNGPSFKVILEAKHTDPPPDALGEDQSRAMEKISLAPTGAYNRLDEEVVFRAYTVSRSNTLFPHPTTEQAEALDESEKKYGDRTMGMMIRKALAASESGEEQKPERDSAYFEALVDKKVKRSSSRMKKIVVASVILVLIATAATGYTVYRSRKAPAIPAPKKDASGQSIAADNRFAIFMLAGKEIDAEQPEDVKGFCSAFAVTRDVLATNAHCVTLAREKYTSLVAIMNGAPANRYRISGMVMHGGYETEKLSPDVGLVRIDGELKHLVSIATAPQLAKIAPGTPMFLYGFPGSLNREDAPEATFVKGDIGRVTTFQQRLGNFGENTLLQHSAYSSEGTSGSPIFNSSGNAIGINAGGYVEDGKALAGYNFAMRIDLINELLPVIHGSK